MLYTKTNQVVLSLLLLISVNTIFTNSNVNGDDAYANQADKQGSWSGTEDCNSKLKIGELRATRIKAHCQEVNKLTALKLHSDTICANDLDVSDARFNNIDTQTLCTNVISTTSLSGNSVCANHLNVWQEACVSSLDAQEVCTYDLNASYINTDELCARALNVTEQLCAKDIILDEACVSTLVANDACVNNLVVSNLEQCGLYRATMTFSTNVTYTLGTTVNWDLILDDPNGDIILSPESAYVAPRSGYYIVLFQLDQFGLTTDNAVLGVPVANPEVLVNGLVARNAFYPYLAFHNEQRSTISGLISLKAGDVVTTRYSVFIMRDAIGFDALDGTVDIISTGTDEFNSVFKIHLLSIDCNGPVCPPCSRIDCVQSCVEICEPCAPTHCVSESCSPVRPTPCTCLPCPKPCCTACPTDECPLIRE